MPRTPTISSEELARLATQLAKAGYCPVERLRRRAGGGSTARLAAAVREAKARSASARETVDSSTAELRALTQRLDRLERRLDRLVAGRDRAARPSRGSTQLCLALAGDSDPRPDASDSLGDPTPPPTTVM